jgi:serine/threonine protein phosphatase PrpC
MTLQPLTIAEHKGRRPYQEDRHFQLSFDQGLAFGVFDGHGGEACSHFCAKNYPAILAAELGSGKPPQEALRASFEKLSQQTRHHGPGSTASVAFIPWDASAAYVAVIGDSPIIIRCAGGKVWVAPEHNVRTNQAEAEAAKARGGFIFDGYLCATFTGNGLQMARALGDAELDKVLSRVPDVDNVPLDAGSWVLVATDGALDPSHANEEEGVVALTALVDGGGDAQAIVDRAIAIPTRDNVTALLVRVG